MDDFDINKLTDKDFVWKRLVKKKIHNQEKILELILKELQDIHDTLKKSI